MERRKGGGQNKCPRFVLTVSLLQTNLPKKAKTIEKNMTKTNKKKTQPKLEI